MSPTTCPECGLRCSIGSLVAREFDNTWVFEVYERMLSTRGVQVFPLRHRYNTLVGLTRCTFHCTECRPPDGCRRTRQTHKPESTGASSPDGRPGQVSV